MVNRHWQGHFGRGIVATPGDFGAMGEEPSHPELLDWLATEFAARGWSTKAMHRLILASATYRQSSRHDPKAAGIDPENALAWRHSRVRLDGEAIRDAMLAASGRLNRAIGATCLSLYACLSYASLLPQHHLHHKQTGRAGDPDFHGGDPRLTRWFLQFFKTYYSHGQIIRITLVALVYTLLLGAPLGHGHEAEVPVGGADPGVTAQDTEDRDAQGSYGLPEHPLVGRGADAVQDHACEVQLGVEGRVPVHDRRRRARCGRGGGGARRRGDPAPPAGGARARDDHDGPHGRS